jgi:preprotein translocase subunit SecG
MNCYFHPNTPAVAQCSDCSRGLCSSCAGHGSVRLCHECNRVRAQRELGMSLGVGAVCGLMFLQAGAGVALVVFYCVAAAVVGWAMVGQVLPRLSALYTIFFFRTTLVYWGIKAMAALCIGAVALPLRTMKNVLRMKELKALNNQPI